MISLLGMLLQDFADAVVAYLVEYHVYKESLRTNVTNNEAVMDVLKRDPYTGGKSVRPPPIADNVCRHLMFAEPILLSKPDDCQWACCIETRKMKGGWPPANHS